MMDQIIAAIEAVKKAKGQCDFLDRAKADALDRLKVAEAEHQHLMHEYVANLGSIKPAKQPAKRKLPPPAGTYSPPKGGGGFDREGRSYEGHRAVYRD